MRIPRSSPASTQTWLYAMSDGREEREEAEKRRQQECEPDREQAREDRVERDQADPWEPERNLDARTSRLAG